MPHWIKVFLTLIPIMVIIDYLWIARIAGSFYRSRLGPLLRMEGDALAPVLWAAGIVYLCIPLGIVLFVLPQVSADQLIPSSLFRGFLFGIVLYGVYDMTNYSLLKDWPLHVAVFDMLWGGTLCAAATLIGALLGRWYG